MSTYAPRYPHRLTVLPEGRVYSVRWHDEDGGDGLLLEDSQGGVHDLSAIGEYGFVFDGASEEVTR